MPLPPWFGPFVFSLRTAVVGADILTAQVIGKNTDAYLRTIRNYAVQSRELDDAIDAVREAVANLSAAIQQHPHEPALGGDRVQTARDQALVRVEVLAAVLEHVKPSARANAIYGDPLE